MEQRDSNKAHYLDMWTEMLWAFLGWPPSTVMEWAREHIYLDQMDDPDDLYYHESPQYWITDLLISESVRGRLSENDHAVLKRRILEAFADEHYHHFPRGTDWRKELLAAALDGVGGLAIALMKLVFGQIRMEANAFGHAPVLQQSRVTRYQRFLMLVDDHWLTAQRRVREDVALGQPGHLVDLARSVQFWRLTRPCSGEKTSMLADHPTHTPLPVTGLERAMRFYAEQLGLTPEEALPDPRDGVFYRCGGTRFLLYPAAAPSSGAHSQMTWLTNDIEADVAALKARGVVFEEYDLPGLKTVNGVATIGASKGAWFKDSEGNLLALGQFS